MDIQKTLKTDALIWIALLAFAAVLAFGMLQRDKHRQFGAIAYGGLPRFQLQTIEGKEFDYLRLKRAVWAVHTGSGAHMEQVASQLAFIAQTTAAGKRHLNILTFAAENYKPESPPNKFWHVLKGSTIELNKMFAGMKMVNEGIVLLVDQDGSIRGRYDFSSPDDFRSFRQDLMRIL